MYDETEDTRSLVPLYITTAVAGAALVAASLGIQMRDPALGFLRAAGVSTGVTLVTTAVIAFLYQTFGFGTDRRIQADAGKTGIVAIHRDRTNISGAEWTNFISRAQRTIWLYGIAEHGFSEDLNVPPILTRVATRTDGDVRILLLDPDFDLPQAIDREQGGPGNGLPGRIATALTRFTKMKDSAGTDGLSIGLYRNYPQVSVVRADDRMLVTHYLRYQAGNTSMTLLIERRPGGVFESYVEHFEGMWRAAKACPRKG